MSDPAHPSSAGSPRRRARALRLALGLFAALATGCVSPSIVPDVSRVRELTGHPELTRDVGEALQGASRGAAIDGRPLTPDASVRLALLHNGELRARLEELGVARGRLMQAALPANPLFEIESLPERDTAVELRVEYDLSSLVLAPLRTGVEVQALAAARREVAAAVLRLGYEVRAAHRAAQAARERLRLTRANLEAFAVGRDLATSLGDSGGITEADAATHVAAHERARLVVQDAELASRDAREALSRLVGLEVDVERLDALPGLPEATPLPPDLEERVLGASHELRAADLRVEAARRSVTLERTRGLLPEVAVDVHSLHGQPSREAATPLPPAWSFGGGVSLTVPLFDRRQGTTAALEAGRRALGARRTALVVALRSTARTVRNHLATARARAGDLERRVVPAQRTLLEQTQLQYDAMQVSLFRLLSARRELLDVELSRVEALRDYWTTAAALDALLAGASVSLETTALATPSTPDSPAGEH